MQDKDLYVIAVMRYKEANPNQKEENLFPMDWDMNNNYRLKIEIISEAISNQVLIKDTEIYKNQFINNKCKVLTYLSKNDKLYNNEKNYF